VELRLDFSRPNVQHQLIELLIWTSICIRFGSAAC